MFTVNNKKLSKSGFGCSFRVESNLADWQRVGSPIISKSLQLGFNFLDTAEVYGNGCSESVIAEVLNASGLGISPVIATKVSPENLSKNKIIEACERSLKRLGLSQIDLYQVHWSNPAIPLEETFEGLRLLLESGKIAEVGVCNFTLLELQRAEQLFKPYIIKAVQIEYNLLDRSADQALIPYCKSSDKTVIAYSPLNQGVLPGSIESRERIKELAVKYEVDLSALILSWVSSRGILPIPNTTNPTRLEQYAAVHTLNVEAEDCEAIDKLFPFEPLQIDPKRISVSPKGLWSPSLYQTLEEARLNAAGVSPSPADLALQFQSGDFLKPVRVKRLEQEVDGYQYELVEGRMRFWGWLIAFGYDAPISVLVRE